MTNLLAGLLVDPAGTDALTETYATFTGQHTPPAEVVHAAKRAILTGAMAAELEAVVAALHALAARDRRDLGRNLLRQAVTETIAALDVYRTYADADGLPAADRPRLDAALAAARRRNPGLDPAAFDFLAAALALEISATPSRSPSACSSSAARRWPRASRTPPSTATTG